MSDIINIWKKKNVILIEYEKKSSKSSLHTENNECYFLKWSCFFTVTCAEKDYCSVL